MAIITLDQRTEPLTSDIAPGEIDIYYNQTTGQIEGKDSAGNIQVLGVLNVQTPADILSTLNHQFVEASNEISNGGTGLQQALQLNFTLNADQAGLYEIIGSYRFRMTGSTGRNWRFIFDLDGTEIENHEQENKDNGTDIRQRSTFVAVRSIAAGAHSITFNYAPESGDDTVFLYDRIISIKRVG